MSKRGSQTLDFFTAMATSTTFSRLGRLSAAYSIVFTIYGYDTLCNTVTISSKALSSSERGISQKYA